MGFFSEDMLPMLGVYQAETTELMGVMDDITTRVEHAGAFTPEDVAELFRCAHTVKGSSAMMGLENLSTLTHRLEDLFDLLRHDPSLAEGRVPDILDQLYAFGDYVKDEVGRMEQPDYAPADATELIADIAACTRALAGEQDAASAPNQVEDSTQMEDDGAQGPPPEPDKGAVVLRVSFKPDVAMVNARAMVIVKKLRGQVNVRSVVPEDLTNADAAKTIAQEGLLIVVDAHDTDAAKRFLAKNSFVNRLDVLEGAAPTADALASRQKEAASEVTASAEKFVTMRWSSVRELQDMVGEFLSHVSRLKALCSEMPEESGLRSVVSSTAHLVDELVYRVDRMAMVSMSAMVPQLSRMVRDMCRSSGKRISFEVHGGAIEIDRNLYNSIADPLVHIIRNAVDHGIELPEERLAAGKDARGKVTLSIENLGARVAFRVVDDGRGINTAAVLSGAEAKGMLKRPASSYTRDEVLRMVMMPGLSTSHEITQYSGRGVGMDVVSAVVRDFNGSVDIASQPGQGTSVTLFMPVSVSSVECLAFRVGPCFCHMPLFNLSKIVSAAEAAESLSTFEGSTLFEFNKQQIPVVDLHRLLGLEGKDGFYVVCRSLNDEFVIGVDDVLGEFGCASKPLPACLGGAWQESYPLRNVTIMNDGTVGYVLNAPLLAAYAQGRRAMPEADDQDAGAREAAVLPDMVSSTNLPSSAFVFSLGEELFALPVEQVQRLAPLPHCSVVPRGLPHLMGLMNDRNRVVAAFDLAGSAGASEDSLYVLIADGGSGDSVGYAITSAVGIRDLSDAALADEQPKPRMLAGGLRTTVAVRENPKAPAITLLSS